VTESTHGEFTLELNLGKLSSDALKTLSKAVDEERKRRSKKTPENHEPPSWQVPGVALSSGAAAKTG
jgi:hypothetical protein